MAEAVGVIASALTIGAGAAQLSLALFSVAQTLKNAPVEIAEIAQEIQSLAESLQMLADIIGGHKNLCKPELFERTRGIISRYNEVDAELRRLIDSPHKLGRLKWCIKKPKAKSLLKKVEGIKVALVLELNIVRLAREEIIRPYNDTNFNVQGRKTPQANRFRRIVESAVQANRQVVEAAQRDEIENSTEQRPRIAAELDIWKAGSFDTATWLYHLVFSPKAPDPPAHRLYQASVEDAEDTNKYEEASSSSMNTESGASTNANSKEMIVWSRQTEPSQVVDRLLYSWTTLSPDQISLSATRDSGDDWREEVMSMIEEAKPEDASSFQDWETLAEEDKDAAEVRQVAHDRILYRAKRQQPSGIHEPDPPSDPPVRIYRPRYTKNRNQPDKRWSSEVGRGKSPPRVHTIISDETISRYDDRPDRKNAAGPVSLNPFNKDYIQSSIHQYAPGSGWGTSPPIRVPYPPPYPPYPPPPPFDPNRSSSLNHPGVQAPTSPPIPFPLPPSQKAAERVEAEQTQPKASDTPEKEDAVLSKLEKLLLCREEETKQNVTVTDARFARLEHLLTSNAEADAQRETENANAITAEQLQHMQQARKIDEQRLEQLEGYIVEQREEQRKMETKWREERTMMDLKAAEQAQEARELVAREIAAAQAAKEAAEASLRFAQSEADRRAREEAAIKVAEEKKKMENAHKEQLQRYEELLRAVKEQQSGTEQNSQGTVRRTRISEGNRSIDVTEYTADKRASSSLLSIPQLGYVQDGHFQSDGYLGRHGGYARSRPGRRDSFHSSVASLHSLRKSSEPTDSSSTSNKSQQLIVFPAKANKSSPAITALQSSLAESGVDFTFEDVEGSSYGQLMPYERPGLSEEQLVYSTILWEPCTLSLGSELLLSLRRSGWKPTYSRTSRKGETHFLGTQPLHTYFFKADYKPQFTTSTTTSPSDESIAIQKALIEEYALIELGFRFELNDMGFYILDGRLSYGDIESLVERSFMLRENNYRRLHRPLQSHYDANPAPTPTTTKTMHPTPASRYRHTYASSLASTSVYETTTYGKTSLDTESEHASTAPSEIHYGGRDVKMFLEPGSDTSGKYTLRNGDDDGDDDDDNVPSLDRGDSSVESPSVISSASNSTNPYRKHMVDMKGGAYRGEFGFPTSVVWDGQEQPVTLI